MSLPLTPDQILSALHEAGLNVYETPGWRDRCRCHNGSHELGDRPSGRAWGPFNGITLHITAGAVLSGEAAVEYCRGILTQGRADVPGPLCLGGIDGDGRIILVSAGRANHIGSISAASLSAMVAASFSLTGWDDKRGHGTDGNTHTLGWEILNPGVPNAAQQDTAVRASAALCRAAGWTGQEVHGHGECSDQRGYSDPGLNMGEIRQRVMAAVESSADPPTPPVPTPEPETPTPVTPPRKGPTNMYALVAPDRFILVDPDAAAYFDLSTESEAAENLMGLAVYHGNARQVDLNRRVLDLAGYKPGKTAP